MFDDGDITELQNWAVDHGCSFNSTHVSYHPSYAGYGLFNSASTSCDDEERTALFIPNSLIISIDLISEDADNCDELANVLNALPELPTVEPIITVFLLYQLHLFRSRKPSKWTAYLKYLPKSTLPPICWTQEEISFLRQCNTSISRAVPAKIRFLRSLFATLQDVTGWVQTLSWDDYLLAESWVSSRCIQDPRTDTPILVPILDMANHSSWRNTAWETTDKGIELRREPLEIEANEELTISYDLDRGTGERLHRYGFIESRTPGTCSKAISLLGDVSPPIAGGNVFRLSLESAENGFDDLSFLTYENWYTMQEHTLT
jgi:hypothetical protein